MCMSGGGAANKIAKQQRADEVARQQRIKAGMASIANIFDGQGVGINAATSYDPSQTYYTADGQVYAPAKPETFGQIMSAMGGNFTTPQQLIEQGKLFTGVQRTGGFNDEYYGKRRQAYIDYAMPELDYQYGNAKDNLVYALARSGIGQSSAALNENDKLSRSYDRNRLGIVNEAINQENSARQNVENTRSNLVAELNATGDNAAAAQAAMRQAANLNMPQGFSPLGQLFADMASGAAAIGSNARNDYAGFFNAGKPLFGGSGSGSSRVVR